jgi:hypothetical protein
MSLCVLRDGSKMQLVGDGYVAPAEADELLSASSLLTQFADEAQLKYMNWADEKDRAHDNELISVRSEERSQVASFLASSADAMNSAIEKVRLQEIEKLRSALIESLSVHAADYLLAAALGKAAETGLIDDEAKVLVPQHSKEKLIEHLGQLLPFEDYLFLTKIVEEQDYVSEGSAIVVTAVEAFKFDARALAQGLLS